MQVHNSIKYRTKGVVVYRYFYGVTYYISNGETYHFFKRSFDTGPGPDRKVWLEAPTVSDRNTAIEKRED